MNTFNWRRSEMEDILYSDCETNLADYPKSWIAEFANKGGLTPKQAENLGVNMSLTYCPQCDAVSSIASNDAGCPVHGKWW